MRQLQIRGREGTLTAIAAALIIPLALASKTSKYIHLPADPDTFQQYTQQSYEPNDPNHYDPNFPKNTF